MLSSPIFKPRFGAGQPTGQAAPGTIYYDTTNSYAQYVFNAGVWNPTTGVGTYAPSVLQNAQITNAQTVNLGVAPTNGNTLICLTRSKSAALTAAGGWTEQFTIGGVVSNTFRVQCFSKIAASDPAALTPITAGVTLGQIAGFEIAHMAGTFDVLAQATPATGVSTFTQGITPTAANELIIGLCGGTNNLNLPTIVGATALNQSTSGTNFSLYPGLVANNNVTANSASSSFALGIAMIAVK